MLVGFSGITLGSLMLFVPRLSNYQRFIDRVMESQKFNWMTGQWYVRKHLKNLNKEDYTRLSNLLFRNDRGLLYHIDHIIVSKYGVFVIETKNVSGRIRGHEREEFWKQKLGKKEYLMYSPIWRTYGHILSLRSVLGSKNKIVPIICFSERSKLLVNAKRNSVVNGVGMLNEISRHSCEVLSPEDICMIIEKVKSRSLSGVSAWRQYLHQTKMVKRDAKKRLLEVTTSSKYIVELNDLIGSIDEPVRVSFKKRSQLDKQTNPSKIVFGGNSFIPSPVEIEVGDGVTVVDDKTVDALMAKKKG